jgi:hypothetical protein
MTNSPEPSQVPRTTKLNEHQSVGLMTAARKLEASEQWLRYVAEEQTRSVVSRMSTGLLVAEKVAADLPTDMRAQLEGQIFHPAAQAPSSSEGYCSTADGLAAKIHETVAARVGQYGIEVYEVSLQEVQLPRHIHDAAVEACKSGYIPFMAQKQAMARKMQLQAEADVLGAETVGAREVVSNAPAFALVDFLTNFLAHNQSLLGVTALQAAGRQNPVEKLK